MPTHLHRRADQRNRSGLSVVEVLIALMLVSIGLLGIAGSSALALRSTLDAAHHRHATSLATSRLAQLSATGCTLAANGSATDAPLQIAEQWTVASRSNGFAIITDSIHWMSAQGPRTLAVTSAIIC
jgi:Tfp pilus assembly protein PilV